MARGSGQVNDSRVVRVLVGVVAVAGALVVVVCVPGFVLDGQDAQGRPRRRTARRTSRRARSQALQGVLVFRALGVCAKCEPKFSPPPSTGAGKFKGAV